MTKHELITKFVDGKSFRAGKLVSICTEDKEYRILYLYNTPIITVARDGQVWLNTGGWYTATTKNYINNVLSALKIDAQVVVRKGDWFVQPALNLENKKLEAFHEGASLNVYHNINLSI